MELSEGASEDISIKFESKCNGTEWMETHLCEGVVIDQEVGGANALFGNLGGLLVVCVIYESTAVKEYSCNCIHVTMVAGSFSCDCHC